MILLACWLKEHRRRVEELVDIARSDTRTCAAGQALTVHQADHFDTKQAFLSCTAAPIYDAFDGLSVALNISPLLTLP